MLELMPLKALIEAVISREGRAARNRFPTTGGTYDMTENWSSSGVTGDNWTPTGGRRRGWTGGD